MPLSIIHCISHLAVPRPILVTDYWVIPTQNSQKFKSIHPKFDALKNTYILSHIFNEFSRKRNIIKENIDDGVHF